MVKGRRAVLFVNGDLAVLPKLRFKSSDFLIGVDGGAKLIKRLNLTPNLVIGDFDSYSPPRSKAKTVFKSSQNLSDTEFALAYCQQQGFADIALVGVLGRRLDHLLTNIFLAAKFNLTIYEGRQTLYFLIGPSGRVLEGRTGDLVSLIPLTDCLGVSLYGLKWPLKQATLKYGTTRGISNVMTGKKARVHLKKGRLAVVYNFL
jgi:thiamine pyrophosphokinase